MSTASELAERALRKLKVIGAVETATPEDLQLAMQAVRDAHNVWSGQGLLRWTLDTIPEDVDLAYVLLASFLMAPEFLQVQEAAWSNQAFGIVQAFVNLPNSGPIYSVEL